MLRSFCGFGLVSVRAGAALLTIIRSRAFASAASRAFEVAELARSSALRRWSARRGFANAGSIRFGHEIAARDTTQRVDARALLQLAHVSWSLITQHELERLATSELRVCRRSPPPRGARRRAARSPRACAAAANRGRPRSVDRRDRAEARACIAHRFEIAVRCRDDAHVDFGSHGRHRCRRHGFCLSTRRSAVCAVIDSSPSPSRNTVPPCACSSKSTELSNGGCEGAALVTEEHADERRRDRAAVDRSASAHRVAGFDRESQRAMISFRCPSLHARARVLSK